ncbi:DNA polymerase [Bacillus subtilis]|uniref:DNA polymerase n=1 Tax=Bacillus subtilis TaxID=1423 RepID=UPI003CF90A68
METEIMEPLMGRGKKTAKIMFVSDTASEYDYYETGKYMTDQPGKLLLYSLKKLGIDLKKDCYFTALVKQPTPENRQPNREEIDAYMGIFEKELEIVNPDIIVPMGNVSLKKVGGKTGITKFRGKATVDEETGRIIFPIVGPDMLFLQPKHTKKWTKDLQNLKELLDKGKNFLERKEVNYRYLEDLPSVLKEIKRMKKSKWVVFDLETTGLDPFKSDSKIVCISLTDRDRYGVTIPLDHKEFAWEEDDFEKVKMAIKLLLEDKKIKKMAHNGKFDMKWLKVQYGIEVANFAFDPLLCHYLTVSEEQGGHGLKNLAWEFTDMGGYDNELDAFKDTLPEKIRHNYDNVPWKILRTYAAADVDCTFRLYKIFKEYLKQDEGWRYVFKNLLLPGSYALADIEINGAKLDEDRIALYEEVFPARTAEIEEKLRQYPEVLEIEREKQRLFELRQLEMKKPKEERNAEILKYNKYKNFKFKFSSTSQLRELLFEKLGLDTPFLTKKGEERKRLVEKRNRGKKKSEQEKFVPTTEELSTGKETLQYLDGKHPIASLLSEWRRIEKVYGTYIKPARSWIGADGLAHPTYNLTGTVTGRLSSENPKRLGGMMVTSY